MLGPARSLVLAACVSLAAASCRGGAAPAPRPAVSAPPDPAVHSESAPSTASSIGAGAPGGALLPETPPGGAPALDASARLPPLSAPGAIVALEVPGFRRAAVSVPVGARRPRPLVVALHGNYDRPEWQCEVWRDITSAFPFVLCPRGIPRTDAPPSEDRWHYGSGEQVRKELDAALEALRERFGAYVDDGPIVYTGFSLGAILGERMVRRDAKRFPRAVLTEGGAAGWTVGAARAFADAGGKRVLFACGQSSCRFDAKGPVAALQKVGLEARVAYGGNIGHTYDGAVADAIAKEWQWLVDGDDRWALSGRAQ